jgi:hypothetical protein
VCFTSLRAAAAASKKAGQQAYQQQQQQTKVGAGSASLGTQPLLSMSDSSLSVADCFTAVDVFGFPIEDSEISVTALTGVTAPGAAKRGQELESMSKPYELVDSPSGPSRLGPGVPGAAQVQAIAAAGAALGPASPAAAAAAAGFAVGSASFKRVSSSGVDKLKGD